MSNVPKKLWPQAFKEGKAMADHVMTLNKRLGKFGRQKPDAMPTDRELLLAGAVNIFWSYHLSQEASHASRILTWTRIEEFILKRMEPTNGDERLLKQVRRLKNGESANGFLRMWSLVEQFIQAGQTEEFWKKFDQPSTAVKALVSDLGVLANIGEESNGKEEPAESGSSEGRTEGQEGAEGVQHQADRGPDSGTGEEGCPDRDGAEEAGGRVQSGGGCLEAAESSAQVPNEEPQREPEEA